MAWRHRDRAPYPSGRRPAISRTSPTSTARAHRAASRARPPSSPSTSRYRRSSGSAADYPLPPPAVFLANPPDVGRQFREAFLEEPYASACRGNSLLECVPFRATEPSVSESGVGGVAFAGGVGDGVLEWRPLVAQPVEITRRIAWPVTQALCECVAFAAYLFIRAFTQVEVRGRRGTSPRQTTVTSGSSRAWEWSIQRNARPG